MRTTGHSRRSAAPASPDEHRRVPRARLPGGAPHGRGPSPRRGGRAGRERARRRARGGVARVARPSGSRCPRRRPSRRHGGATAAAGFRRPADRPRGLPGLRLGKQPRRAGDAGGGSRNRPRGLPHAAGAGSGSGGTGGVGAGLALPHSGRGRARPWLRAARSLWIDRSRTSKPPTFKSSRCTGRSVAGTGGGPPLRA